MPATVDEALAAFADRKREPAPLISTFEAPPSWPAFAREATATVWARRVVNETHSVELGERILICVQQLALSTPSLERGLQRLIEDERSHVEITRAFIDRLGATQPVVSAAFASDEDPRTLLLRCVTTGLAVCESVSAARFAEVRQHTDLPIPRACIETFLRDEIAHAELGFILLPEVISFCERSLGRTETHALLTEELRATFLHLETAIGLDAHRKKLALQIRAQPPMNAGVVEPMIDAHAFYEAITRSIIPRLAKLNIDARAIWESRF